MKLLILIFFSLQSAFAQTPAKPRQLLQPERIIYNPGGNKPGRFVVSYKDYEDVRIDLDLDGHIDYWRVRKDSLQVEIYYKLGEMDRFYVRKVGADTASEFYYKSMNGSLVLQQARTRELFGRTFTSSKELCQDSYEATKKEVLRLTEIAAEGLYDDLSEKILHRSCVEMLSPREFRRLRDQVDDLLKNSLNNLASCIESDGFKEKFYAKNSQTELTYKILAENIKLKSLQIAYEPVQFAGMLKCEEKEIDPFIPASANEDGSITFHKDSSGKHAMNFSKDVLLHEFLHNSELFDENATRHATEYCSKNRDIKAIDNPEGSKSVPIIQTNTEVGNAGAIAESTATTEQVASAAATTRAPANVASTPTGSQLAAQNSSANIPKAMAASDTAAPSSQTLSLRMASPSPKTDVGSQQALTGSVSESRGVLSRANNLIGAMSTPASAGSLASSETRRSKIEANIDKVDLKTTVGTRVPGSGGGLKADRLASGDRVVEQITLDDSGPTGNSIPGARAPAAVSSASAAPMPAEVAGRVGASRGGPSSAPASSEIAGAPGGSSLGGGSSMGGGSLGGGSLGGGSGGSAPAPTSNSIPPARSVASADGAAGSAAATTTNTASAPQGREAMITMFSSRNSYAVTKNRLKEQSFNQELQSQNITIMDLYGNSYGATKGEVIFLDEGNRFVRQK